MKNLLPLINIQLFALACCCLPALADDDPVLNAMTDEMTRSIKSLRIDQHPPPYFVAYTVDELDEDTYSSILGSNALVNHSRDRFITPVVKLGSYDLDSNYPLTNRPEPVFTAPDDNDYQAFRKWLWLYTDQAYKNAITRFEWKKAYLSSNNVPDRLPDMTRETPVVSINPIASLAHNDKSRSTLIEQLSSLFKNYPSLQKSKVTFIARTLNRWYVNSEGSKIRDSHSKFFLRICAVHNLQTVFPLKTTK